ncbi:MAG: CcmD family protein [Ignavibacteriales bacterium]|nr:CcmD family protein [Ignavibacteriales bacterium]
MMEFFSQNQLFIVMTIVLIIWAGIVWYLMRIESRLKQLEDHSKKG